MMILAMDKGSRNFQPKSMSWSYRKRGSVPRIQMYKKMKKKTFSENHPTGSRSCSMRGPKLGIKSPNGLFQPPRNSNVARLATVHMLAYSATKNMANFME